jgi:hypothetical protein
MTKIRITAKIENFGYNFEKIKQIVNILNKYYSKVIITKKNQHRTMINVYSGTNTCSVIIGSRHYNVIVIGQKDSPYNELNHIFSIITSNL